MDTPKYVYVEMILNKVGSTEVVGGLFKGVINRKGHEFIVLGDKESPIKKTHLLNTAYYDILMIETLDCERKTMLFLTAEKEDQQSGKKIVLEHYDAFIKTGAVLLSDKEIIDISKYKDVPEDYSKDGKDQKDQKHKTTGIYSGVNSEYSGYSGYNRSHNTSYTIKKEIVPLAFGYNDTTAPDVVENMKNMMKMISDGTFSYEIPQIIGGEASVAEAKSYLEEHKC